MFNSEKSKFLINLDLILKSVKAGNPLVVSAFLKKLGIDAQPLREQSLDDYV